MFDPKPLQMAGLAMQTSGAYFKAQGEKISYNAAADVADANARYAEMQAESALAAGQVDEGRSRLSTAQLKSTQRATMAANGVDLSVGTASDILASTDAMGEADAQQIKANAINAAFGARVSAANFQNEARTDRYAAKSISPVTEAFSTFLGNAGQVSERWYQYDKASTKTTRPKISSTGKGALSTSKQGY